MILVFFVLAFFGRNKLILSTKIKKHKNTKNKRYIITGRERERERRRDTEREGGRER
jgi:hypothetical protein